MSEWIDIKFAVPPDDRDVLVNSKWIYKKNTYNKIQIAQRIVFKNGNIKWRCSAGSGFIYDGVTHWVPLPEPPTDT